MIKNTGKFYRLIIVLLLASLIPFFSFGQVSITGTSAVTDNLASSTGSGAPANWTIQGTGARGTTWNGTAQTTGTSGGWYGNGNISFLGSGTASNGNATWLLQNNTGSAITGFTLSFVARLWKTGTASPAVSVSYQNSATNSNPAQGALSNSLGSLVFTDATTNIATGTTLSQTVTGISIPNGDYIFVRFIHAGGGNSDNLGWDDVSFTATIGSCTPTDLVTYNGTNGNSNSVVTWTNPSCYDDILVVASSSAFSSVKPNDDGTAETPSSNSFTDAANPSFDGGKVVYRGTAGTVTISNLTNGTSYYIKLFVRKGTTWSNGVVLTVTPVAPCTVPVDLSVYAATGATSSAIVSWTNPSCYDDILIVVKASSPFSGAQSPTGSGYTINSQVFTDVANPSLDGGTMVYEGVSSPKTITGLTNGTTYYIKFFVRRNSSWSAGVTATVTPSYSSTGTSDYFRSKAAGPADWNLSGSWESSFDGSSVWITATAVPTSGASGITIQSGHTIKITTGVTVNKTTVNGTLAVYNDGTTNLGSVTLSNTAADELTISNGGIFQFVVSNSIAYASVMSFSTTGNINVSSGGKILIGDGTSTHNGGGFGGFAAATSSQVTWNNGSIFEWSTTSVVPSTSGVTYFPSVSASVIPIFRFTAINTAFTIGGSSATVINGLLEVNTAMTWQNSATKTFRNGIRNSAQLTQNSNCGQFIINGTTAQLDGVAAIVLSTGGLAIGNGSSATTVTLVSGKSVNSGTVTINNLAILDMVDKIIDGNSTTVVSVLTGGTIKTSNLNGFSGSGTTSFTSNIQSSNINVTAGTIDYTSSSATSQVITAGTYGNISNSISGPRTLATSGIIKVGKSFSPGTGTYTVTGSTVEFNGTAGQTIPDLNSNTSLNDYYNLTYSGDGTLGNPAYYTGGSNLNIGNIFSNTKGYITFNNSVSAVTVNIYGNFSQVGPLTSSATDSYVDLQYNSGITTVNFYGSSFLQTDNSGIGSTGGTTLPTFIFAGSGQQQFNALTSLYYIEYINFTIETSSTLVLNSDFDLIYNTNYPETFLVKGTLDCGTAYGIVRGANENASSNSVFKVNAGGTIITANSGGLDGCISSSNITRTFTAGANYIFNGATSVPFPVSFSSPANDPANITFNAAVTLNMPVSATATVMVTGGNSLDCNGLQVKNTGGETKVLGQAKMGNYSSIFSGSGKFTLYPDTTFATFTGAISSGSKLVTGVTFPSDITAGMAISGSVAGIPAGTYISSLDASANTITLSKFATASVSSLALTVSSTGSLVSGVAGGLSAAIVHTSLVTFIDGADYVFNTNTTTTPFHSSHASSFKAKDLSFAVTATLNRSVTVNGTLTLPSNAALSIGSNTLTINKNYVQGTGTLSGSSTSKLAIGSATTGSINFTNGARMLSALTLTAGASASLGTPLDIIAGNTSAGPGKLALGNSAVFSTNNQLTLKSDASGTAMVDVLPVDVSGNPLATVNGKVTVERYIPAMRSWRLLTSPLSNTGTIYSTWQQGAVVYDANNASTQGIGTYVTGPSPSALNGLDNSPLNNYSMKSWDNTTQNYVNIGNTLTNLSGTSSNAANTGYFMFVRGDRNPLNTNVNYYSSTTLSATGNLQTGDQDFSFTATAPGKTRYFRLIGNPFAAPINFISVYPSTTKLAPDPDKLTGLLPRLVLYDPEYRLGQFAYLEDDGTHNGYDVIAANPSNLSQYIQSGQSFFVEAEINANVTFKIKENTKTASLNVHAFRPATPAGSIGKMRINLMLIEPDSTARQVDGAMIQFSDAFSNDVTLEDALKFINFNENLGINRDNNLLALERRKIPVLTDSLFLRLWKTTPRDYQLRFSPMNLQWPGIDAYLEDRFTGNLTRLDQGRETIYAFNINGSSSASSAQDRFRIIFKTNPVMNTVPVSYIALAAQINNNQVLLNWSVDQIADFDSFEIESSADGLVYFKIGSVSDFLTNAFSFYDIHPLYGQRFYRIKGLKANGGFLYSPMKKVYAKTVPSFSIISNSGRGEEIQLEIINGESGQYQISLINTSGQMIDQFVLLHNRISRVHKLQLNNIISSSVYFLKITDPQGFVSTIRFVPH